MTNLGQKTLNVVLCYCHHNNVEGAKYHQRQHLPHDVAHDWLTHVLVETFLPTVLLHGCCAPAHVLPDQESKRRKRIPPGWVKQTDEKVQSGGATSVREVRK
ncbi:hypothetical protein TNCV_1964071 [Trichonephila clavipes]|nr:hypothetical protein TNCV_1964071 [Trichonephila clavipes]